MKTAYVLAIDLGTSGPKVGLVSMSGEVAGARFEPCELILSERGGAEQDPADWWQAITTAATRLVGLGLVPVEEIAAICCTSQYSGTVAIDREGNPLTNAIIWMDTRGSRHIRKVVGGAINIKGYGPLELWRWIRLTGGAPGLAGKDSIAHILYIKNELPEVYERTWKFLEPMDYLDYRFTGRVAASYESITLHWLTDNRDIDRIDYHPALLRMAGVERDRLPDLKPSLHVLGPLLPEAAAALGVPPGIPVVMGLPDTHSAALGSGAVRDYQAHLYIGTSSWIICHVPFKKTDLLHHMAALPSAIPGRYCVMTEQETAGACLTYLRDNILFHEDELLAEPRPRGVYELFDRIVERVPAGANKVIFTPWLYGERTPVDDSTVRAAFYNLSLTSTREHMIRAVFEGVALNTRWLLFHLERFIGRRLDAINFIGGGARSAAWSQILADVLERPIRQMADPINAGLRGAAVLAAVALGRTSFDAAADAISVERTFEPTLANKAVYDELFREFVRIYEANKAIYSRLNRS